MFFPVTSVEETRLTNLDNYSVIHITGNDSLEFLSNQFTNDLKSLKENFSSLGAWCSVKGRVLYLFRIWRQGGDEGDDFFLMLPRAHTESFLKRLRMFILRADVKAELADDFHIFGLSGKEADGVLGSHPDQDNEVRLNSADSIIKLPAPVPRYLVITKDASFKAGAVETSSDKNTWQLLDIMAGIAEIWPDTSDKFLPQMLNLETLGGLSFQKGCYPGQEIVARVKYRGELKKQLYQATVNTDQDILPGASLLAVDSDSDNSVGLVVSSASLSKGSKALLAVIDIKMANVKSIRLSDDSEAVLILESK